MSKNTKTNDVYRFLLSQKKKKIIIIIKDRLEYSEKSWKLEETCSHSDSSERPPASDSGKNSHKQIEWQQVSSSLPDSSQDSDQS